MLLSSGTSPEPAEPAKATVMSTAEELGQAPAGAVGTGRGLAGPRGHHVVGTHAAQSANLGPGRQQRQRRTLSPGPSARRASWAPDGHHRARGEPHSQDTRSHQGQGPRPSSVVMLKSPGPRRESGHRAHHQPKAKAAAPPLLLVQHCPEPGEGVGARPGQAHLRQHRGAPGDRPGLLPSPRAPSTDGPGAAPLACPASHTSAQGWQKHKNGSPAIHIRK